MILLLHGWYNTVNLFVVLPFENIVMSTVSAILPWAVAAYVSTKHGDEDLADRPRATLSAEMLQQA